MANWEKMRGHLLAIRRLNGEQVIADGLQALGSEAVDHVEKRQFVGIVQRRVVGEVVRQLRSAGGIPGQLAGHLVEGLAFPPEEDAAERDRAGAGGLVERLDAIHQNDDAAVIASGGIEGGGKSPIFTIAELP